MILKVLVSCLLLHAAIAQWPPCKEVYYDFYSFALTWPREFCTEKVCKPGWDTTWDGKSFTIHGFWPSSTDLSYLSCFRDHDGVDPYCNRPFQFNQSLFSQRELADLNKYWPQFGKIDNFWAYEWGKHGVCYLHIFKDEYKSNMTDTQLFKRYFTTTIDKLKSLNISLVPATFQTKSSFAKKINLKQSQFYAICGKDNELDEIRICYDIYHEPGKEILIDCPASTDRNLCKFPMVVK